MGKKHKKKQTASSGKQSVLNKGIVNEEHRIHCPCCYGLILKTDKYCQYCGKPMDTKPS